MELYVLFKEGAGIGSSRIYNNFRHDRVPIESNILLNIRNNLIDLRDGGSFESTPCHLLCEIDVVVHLIYFLYYCMVLYSSFQILKTSWENGIKESYSHSIISSMSFYNSSVIWSHSEWWSIGISTATFYIIWRCLLSSTISFTITFTIIFTISTMEIKHLLFKVTDQCPPLIHM